MKYKHIVLAGGRGWKERKSIICWSHNNRSVVFGKTDAQQTGKTINHIKGKKKEKKKDFA